MLIVQYLGKKENNFLIFKIKLQNYFEYCILKNSFIYFFLRNIGLMCLIFHFHLLHYITCCFTAIKVTIVKRIIGIARLIFTAGQTETAIEIKTQDFRKKFAGRAKKINKISQWIPMENYLTSQNNLRCI